MRTVHFSSDHKPPQVISEATESVLIVVPELDDETLRPLFALSEPVDVNLLTRRDAVANGGAELRGHVKQLQDINLNVDVRVTDEEFPALTVVDGEHLHCHSEGSRRLAGEDPDDLAKAVDALWARSQPLKSTHHDDNAAEVTP